MQNFNGKVRQYLKENERKKRSRLFGVVLSVVMTVSVLASLVMPAISATEGTSVAGGNVSYNGGSYSYKDANSVTIKSYDAVQEKTNLKRSNSMWNLILARAK